MGGGLMQLVAYGAQDIYLTGNPQITFFKVVYRRHTNFSMESIRQTFSGTTGFGNDVTATISRNGDLVHRMYLEHTCTFQSATSTHTNTMLCEHYGHSLIKECEIEIGGQRIDKHTSMWNRVWSDLTEYNPTGKFGLPLSTSAGINGGSDIAQATADQGTLYQLMTGNGNGLNTGATGSATHFSVTGTNIINGFTYNDRAGLDVGRIFLPLNFWFNRNPGLALPLIALQYHEVKVKMTFETQANLARSVGDSDGSFEPYEAHGSAVDPTFDLWADYIYLDTDERRRFAQVSHEYLIEQLQISDNIVQTASPTIDLNFNHPVKELIWCTRSTGTNGRNTNNTGASGDPGSSVVSLDEMGGNWLLKLNGHDRFKERTSKYFTRNQIWQHHTGYGAGLTISSTNSSTTAASALCGRDPIAVYSFALKPEEHQPSGTCNFSRIDNAQLVGTSITVADADGTTLTPPASGATQTMSLTIFAVNYNVLRIMSGMGGLAYSN